MCKKKKAITASGAFCLCGIKVNNKEWDLRCARQSTLVLKLLFKLRLFIENYDTH